MNNHLSIEKIICDVTFLNFKKKITFQLFVNITLYCIIITSETHLQHHLCCSLTLCAGFLFYLYFYTKFSSLWHFDYTNSCIYFIMNYFLPPSLIHILKHKFARIWGLHVGVRGRLNESMVRRQRGVCARYSVNAIIKLGNF